MDEPVDGDTDGGEEMSGEESDADTPGHDGESGSPTAAEDSPAVPDDESPDETGTGSESSEADTEESEPVEGPRPAEGPEAAPPAGDAVEPAEKEAGEPEIAEGESIEAGHHEPETSETMLADEDLTAGGPPGGGGPSMDQEQPLAEHIEEMVKRLAIVIVVAGVVSLAVFPYGEEAINFLWYSILPGTDVSKPHIYHPLELLLTQLKVASLAGLIIALPVFVYETYAFMRPGLYPHERRYYLAAIPTSLILAFVGVLFAYFIVLPAVMSYFLSYSQTVVNIAFALGQTFDLILVLMGYLALVFQIPLFIMLAIMMGLTTRQWMEDRRLIFWGVFAGISFLFSPDPTGMAPAIIALTMIVLFEGTLLLLRWTGR